MQPRLAMSLLRLEVGEESFARPNGFENGTRFGYFRCFAHRFRLPRESLHQVPVALYWTLVGFSYLLGTQNLSVAESREDEYQILSTVSSESLSRAMNPFH